MAQTYPIRLDTTHPRLQGKRGRAEIDFFHVLKEQLVDDDWKILWGRDLQSPKNIDGSSEGEADFILLHPRYGLFVLEVKGGGLEYRADTHTWISWGRKNEEHELAQSPIYQVKRTRRLLMAIFDADESCPPYMRARNFQIQWALVFNQCRVFANTLPSDLPAELVLDEDDLDNIETHLTGKVHGYFVSQAMDRIHEQLEKMGRRNPHYGRPRDAVEEDVLRRQFAVGDEGWQYLRAKFLASDLTVKAPRLSTQIRQEANEIRMLTDEQYRVIEMLEDHDLIEARVRGCSGSGKTLCAVELARRLARKKQKVLLLCYNPALADWLYEETTKFRQYVDADTIHGYCRAEFSKFLIPAETAPLEKRDDIMNYDWPMLVVDNLSSSKKKYDVIIVDEAQDYRGLWWEVVPKLRRSIQSRLIVFYDENQILYKDCAIQEIPVKAPPLTLRRNCRNTQRIHQLIRCFYQGSDDPISQGPQGTLPRFFIYNDDYAQIDGVRRLLARWGEGLRDRAQPYDNVLMLTLHGRTRTFLHETPRLGNVNLIERPNKTTEAIAVAQRPYTVLWSTDRRFKGLESDAVILVDIDQGANDEFASNLLYVGGSRARHRLYGFVHQRAIDWLRQCIGSKAEFYEDVSALAALEL